MPEQGFVIVRDARGSLAHVRTRDGECIGCIEVGLYEVVRALVLAERTAAEAGEGTPASTAPAHSTPRKVA